MGVLHASHNWTVPVSRYCLVDEELLRVGFFGRGPTRIFVTTF